MSKGSILVVGGAGYIGSQVNKELCEAGYHTIVFDNLSTGSRETVTTDEFVEGDIGDERALTELFCRTDIDAVMHFAADIDVGESVRNPQKYYNNNLVKTKVLLDTMLKHDIKKIIFSSTAAIFGIPEKGLIDEDHLQLPINPYGESKLMVERILRDYDKAYGLRYCSFRYFNAAGGDPQQKIPYLKQKETNLIPVLLRNLKNGNSRSTIFGTDYPTRDGTCVRDYIHICDLADAHIKGLNQLLKGAVSRVYNLGNGKGYTVKEVVDAVNRVTNSTLNITEGPRREGDPHTLIADGTKAKTELKWTPRYSLKEMIEHAWNAMKLSGEFLEQI
ncbi:MAG: UDP-glucose 4-epimerase GalE [Chlamydiota bacterium]|nr:UDP-glucose 4-epimerase GalE [Chlamydiota bacterium]